MSSKQRGRKSASITRADVLETGRRIASSVGADPRRVIVQLHEPYTRGDLFTCEVTVARGIGARESGDSAAEALARAYQSLREQETSMLAERTRRGPSCSGASSRGSACAVPRLYSVTPDRKLRDSHAVRLGMRSVSHPDARMVYGASLNDVSPAIERAFAKNGTAWHLDVLALGLREPDHYNLARVRGETSAKRAAAGVLNGYHTHVRSAYLSHVRADGAVIVQWRRVNGRWLLNL